MQQIPLANNKGFALVDDDFYSMFCRLKWYKSKQGYAMTAFWEDGKSHNFSMHRMIMQVKGHEIKGMSIDHINHNPLDNRIDNLRVCTQSQNAANGRKSKDIKTYSQYKGVSFRKDNGRWIATIRVKRKQIHLGYFDTEVEAAAAYNQAALKHFGEFAYLNTISL